MSQQQPDAGSARRPGTATGAAIIGIVVVAAAMLLSTRPDPLVDAQIALGAMLLLAALMGIFLPGRTSLRLTLVLALVGAAAATLGLPDLGRQLEDGAFWLALGWGSMLVLSLVAWAIGGLVRRIGQAIVETQP